MKTLKDLKQYRIDLFLEREWLGEIAIVALSIRDADRQIVKLGKRRWDFDSWGTPRRVAA